MTHILIPREPSTALLRPFIGCNTQELHEAWAAMVRIAEVQHARAGSQCPAQIEQSAALAGTTIEQYARMFNAACEALGQISDCLGINSDINPGAEPIIAAIEQLRAGSTHPVLDDRWKARMLDGRAIERDEMGLGDHPELPLLDEGMMPRSFFAALGLELAHTSAEDQLDGDVLGAMSEAVNWTDWLPTPPHGDGWKLVSIFDTEDGPVAWWLRELPEAEDGTTTIRNLQAEVENLKASAARVRAAPAAVAGPVWGEQQVHALAIHMAASAPPSHKPRDYDADMAWARSALGFIAGHAPAAPALEAPAAPAPAVPDGWRLVPIEFLRGFGTLAHNYSLTAIAPDHYWGNERSAFSDAYARCGQDLTKLRDMLSAEAPPLAAAPQAPAAPGAAITDAQVDAYLTTQRRSVEQADRLPMGITPTHAVREACRQGLLAAIGAAPAAPAVDAGGDGWYLQDTRSYVGNDVLWWAKDGKGYTTDVSKAHVFTREEAFSQAAMRGVDRAWPKAYIDGKTRPAVDMQYINHDQAIAAQAAAKGADA
ncbi:hypothetical protein [Delftia acidovorans]|uniref:hypothetical protein n=1 Tax=Delftia acidovorans TaxID=80866 RepID=UPI0028A6461F|nr:hypothetical protein [Delftia acidovorans]